MHIESIQVGTPKRIAPDWTTAIYKKAVEGSVHLTSLNLAGDRQADLSVHGGADKAVNVYPIEHYRYWNQRARFPLRKRVSLPAIPNGAFGENFTVSNLFETEICIGDTFKIGNAVVQVSQPRQPCWKLARKWNQPKLPLWVQQTGKTGWYFRVIQEGNVEAGHAFQLVERHCPEWSIAKANELMHSPKKSLRDVEKILMCAFLSSSWQHSFQQFLDEKNSTAS